ncbi:JM154 [macacine gammaherpesvirus 11]|uniref:JM154 n=2 Tax=macacine gammaherpesvirus 11 TaxID=2560570 RepID=G9JMY1_9GAMA|nr:JM154 [Macaca fuscata rhadinovirus]AAT00131.1 JM154 [Macaca fuscata rhadinovirus]AEW87678.1 JM154 [Macaca fuscata rhadinovirus]AEW87848.1 JM154 [Macaca fuscata rhadinovirus]
MGPVEALAIAVVQVSRAGIAEGARTLALAIVVVQVSWEGARTLEAQAVQVSRGATVAKTTEAADRAMDDATTAVQVRGGRGAMGVMVGANAMRGIPGTTLMCFEVTGLKLTPAQTRLAMALEIPTR